MKNVLQVIEDQIWVRTSVRVSYVWDSIPPNSNWAYALARHVRESVRRSVRVPVENQPISGFILDLINNYPIENYKNERC
jgi:hypothetical protein